MTLIMQPGAAFCPLCRDRLTDGQLYREAEVQLDGMWRPVVLHAACAEQVTTNPEANAQMLQHLLQDYALYLTVMQTRLQPGRPQRSVRTASDRHGA